GYPLCEKCHARLEIAADNGRTTTTCACGESAHYELPGAARNMTRALQAIIAVEHRADRRPVKVEQGGAVIAVACPSCNAPLEAKRREQQRRSKEEEAKRLAEVAAESEQYARARRESDRRTWQWTAGLSVLAIGLVFGGAYLLSKSNTKKKSSSELDQATADC